MTDAEQRLLELLTARSFKRAKPDEPFTLASGAKSEYFIDGKMTAVSSEGADLIGEVLYQWTKDARIDAIGGLQVGAIPPRTLGRSSSLRWPYHSSSFTSDRPNIGGRSFRRAS